MPKEVAYNLPSWASDIDAGTIEQAARPRACACLRGTSR